jgi:hypothetical protein
MDTFCVLPWYSLELPANSPCCLLPKNIDIAQVKKDLLTGIKSPACSKCWQIESGREISLKDYQEKIYAQDRAKRINIKDYLPEISTILNN